MENRARILYAEDDEVLAYLTVDQLKQNQFEVVHCRTGTECLQEFKGKVFDLCILDIMLPGLDGFELVSKFRDSDKEIPILFLSAKTLKDDRVKGLRLGADDFLVKPFSMEELLLKIDVFLRRSSKSNSAVIYQVGSFIFDHEEGVLSNTGQRHTLTRRESQLLKYFIDHKEQVLRREMILKALWGDDDYFMGRSLDVFVSRLRKVLKDEPRIKITNIHGVGFKYSLVSST